MSTFDEYDLKEALVIIKRGEHECRALVEHVRTDDDDNVAEVEVVLGYGSFPTGRKTHYHTTEWHDLGDHIDVKPGEIVRIVELVDFLRLPANYDYVDLASAAADWMRATMSESDALDGICYMLPDKFHKYMAEAWLGGCDGLELVAAGTGVGK